MFGPFRVLFSVLFFLSLTGCAAKQAELIFESTLVGKTTGSNSRFQLIDDFNAGISKTKVGTTWKTSDLTTKLEAEKNDAVKYGGSMAFEYDLTPASSVSVIAPLDGLDTSQAKFLVLLLRKAEWDQFSGKLEIALSDLAGQKAFVKVKGGLKPWSGPTEEWLQIVLPKIRFQNIDFNQLDQFELILSSGAKAVRGRLVLDEIGFFGDEEVVFRSQKDNLVGFPTIDVLEERRHELLALSDNRKFLREIARDTWLYFEHLLDRDTHLIVDHIRVSPTLGIGSYISPTNMALYWLANIAAFDLSLISKEKAVQNIQASLDTFEKLARWKSIPGQRPGRQGMAFWYNFYHTGNLKVTRKYISTVDNGWLAAGLTVVRSAFPEEFSARAEKILKQLNFSEFYDGSNGQLKLGFDEEKGKFAPYHYGLLATEARLTSYVAIGKGDLEPEHWARIYRTLPVEWDWQKQVPEGRESKLFGFPVFEGHYSYLGKKFIPSWGGSLFEFLAPTLLVDEQAFGKENLGKNNEIATDLHIKHALKEQKYPVWGIAPCAIRNGKYWIYREYGIPQMGAKGYADRGVVAPYASFLALATRPEAAIENFRQILSRYPDSYGEYGFYDSIDVMKGNVNHQYLALDQAMSLLAIVNYLEHSSLRRRFHSDPIGKKTEMLLEEEKFSI